ncbi:Serine/threonine-protein phosphatase 2A activator [Mortierella sp. GBA30]|nr:Serine/threonine-protein phosphatase 2A activator [Mortierella sp. GBA30]
MATQDATQNIFMVPIRCIKDESKYLPFFQKSEAYARIILYILALNNAGVNRKVSDPVPESDATKKIVALLDTLDSWIDQVPPKADPQCFGNVPFRDYIHLREEMATTLLETLLPQQLHAAIQEISPYLTQGLGHGIRIDCGSGHGLSFVAWLACIEIIGFVKGPVDNPAVVLRVFVRYLELVRKLQRTYQLEPAGSHGVRGLED